MPTNPGVANLVSWWSLDEASGTRADSHGSNDLTDNNTVGSTTGKQGNAASLLTANSEYLSVADNASLAVLDFTVVCWFNLDNTTQTSTIIGQWSNSGDERSYQVAQVGNDTRLLIATEFQSVRFVNWGSSLSAGTWYFLAAGYDSGTGKGFLSIDGAAAVETATGVDIHNSGSDFRIGARDGAQYLAGDVDEAALFSQVLTSDEISWLYNSGAGRAYADLTATGLAQPLSGPFGRLLTGLVR